MVFLLSCSLIARGAALDGVVDQHLTDQAPKRPAVLFRRRLQLAAQRPGNADNDLLVTDCLRHGYPRVIANMHCIVIDSDAPREGLISKGRRAPLCR
jgi:hypothetical protein